MRHYRHTQTRSPLVAVFTLTALHGLATLAACGGLERPEWVGTPTGAADSPAPAEEPTHDVGRDIGLVEFALQVVPADIQCLRVTADGPYRQKDDLLATVPGMDFSQTLSGYPLGLVTFRADAFSQACAAVTSRTVPAWISDSVTVSIVDGSKTKVTFSMHRNGRIDAVFDFAEEPACSAEGIRCASVRECCSGACAGNVCVLATP